MSIDNSSLLTAKKEGFFHIEVIEQTESFIALITTRRGGISQPPYDSLNMSDSVGDELSFVEENRWRLANHLNTQPDKFIALSQIHSDIIYDESNINNSGFAGDGHLISQPGYFAVISVADCVPLFIADPVNRVIGIIHAGWRGLHQSIVSKAIHKMRHVYRTDPDNIIAIIGPSIGPCHYEVKMDLIIKFQELLGFECIFYEQQGNRYYLNLWAITHHQLISNGVYPGRVYIQHQCTACHPDLYFSHRRSDGNTGRMWAVIGLRAPESG